MIMMERTKINNSNNIKILALLEKDNISKCLIIVSNQVSLRKIKNSSNRNFLPNRLSIMKCNKIKHL